LKKNYGRWGNFYNSSKYSTTRKRPDSMNVLWVKLIIRNRDGKLEFT